MYLGFKNPINFLSNVLDIPPHCKHVMISSTISAMAFFRDGLGLPVVAANEKYAQVQAGPTNIVLKAVDG